MSGLLLCLAFVGPHPAAAEPLTESAVGPEATAPAAQRQSPEQTVFADDFQTDSRVKYEMAREVLWEKGRLILAPGGSLIRSVQAGSPVELTAQLDFPPLAKDGDLTETQLHLVLNGNHWIHVAIHRRQAGQAARGEIRLAHSLFLKGNRYVDRPIRRFFLAEAPKSGAWKVRYHFGLLEVYRGTEEMATGYIPDFHFQYPTAIAWTQEKGSASCRRLEVRGVPAPPPLTDQQKTSVTSSAQANLEASRLVERGRYAEAAACAARALQLARKAFGERHPWTVDMLASMGMALEQSENVESRAYYDLGIRMAKEVFGRGHPKTAMWIAVLGASRARMGDPAALPCYARALEIQTRTLGEESTEVASTHSLMGDALEFHGQHSAAAQHYGKALQVSMKIQGEDDPNTARLLAKMMSVLSARRAYQEARQYGERAVRAYEKIGRGVDFDLVRLRIDLAVLARRQGDRDAARASADAAFKLLEPLAGNDRQRADCFVFLGGFHLDQEDYPKALLCFEKAQGLYAKVFGEESPAVARSLSLTGSVYLAQSQYAMARPCFERAYAIQATVAERVVPALSEAEALEFASRALDQRDMLLHCLRAMPDARAADAYQAVWETRSVVTRCISLRTELSGNSPESQVTRDALRAARKQLAELALAPVPQEKAAARRERLQELSERKEALERELARRNSAFRAQCEARQASVADLARRLPGDVAFVDILRASKESLADRIGYHAFVLRKTDRDPGDSVAWVWLGPAAPIDEAVQQWREELAGQGRRGLDFSDTHGTRQTAAGRRLRELVWDKLEPHVGGCTTVLIVPDAALTRVPWSALPGRKDGSYLVEQYAIATATDGQQVARALAARSRDGAGQPRLLLVGGVDYDDAQANVPVGRPATAAGRGPAFDPQARPQWRFLTGTLAEIQELAQTWGRPKGVVRFEGRAANEAALREEMPKADYLHLATHGFFADAKFRSAFQIDPAEGKPGPVGLEMTPGYAAGAHRNPLVLSGLVLAGANVPQTRNEWREPLGDDGILTAEEVAGMDLSRAELVVLSACQTGLGDVASGEGVFGLQRAFALAGAQTVIASLWKVDDAATRALMIEFYKNLWEKKLGKLESLRQAQLTMLREYDPKAKRLLHRGPGAVTLVDPAKLKAAKEAGGKPLEPLYWAGFVLNGDWR